MTAHSLVQNRGIPNSALNICGSRPHPAHAGPGKASVLLRSQSKSSDSLVVLTLERSDSGTSGKSRSEYFAVSRMLAELWLSRLEFSRFTARAIAASPSRGIEQSQS